MKTHHSPSHYQAVLLQGAWFSAIPLDLRQALLAHAVILPFAAGQAIFSYGDPEQGIYAVISGMVSVARQREDGKQALLAMIEPPNWFGEITLFDRQQRTHNAQAVIDSQLIYVSGRALDNLLTKQPQYWPYFGLLLTSKIRVLMDIAEDMVLCSTTQRVAKRLLWMAEGYGGLKQYSRRVIEIPQEQLAIMLFMTRQTVNQLLKELARQQLIKLNYGAIEILDIDALRAFAYANHAQD